MYMQQNRGLEGLANKANCKHVDVSKRSHVTCTERRGGGAEREGHLDEVLGPAGAEHAPAAEAVHVAAVLGHLLGARVGPGVDEQLWTEHDKQRYTGCRCMLVMHVSTQCALQYKYMYTHFYATKTVVTFTYTYTPTQQLKTQRCAFTPS